MDRPRAGRSELQCLKRLEAVRLVASGLSQTEVARRLGVSRQSVSRWLTMKRKIGDQSLCRAERAGRRPALSAEQKEILKGLLARRGRRTWTCIEAVHLIEKEFGVTYHPGHVWKILASLGIDS